MWDTFIGSHLTREPTPSPVLTKWWNWELMLATNRLPILAAHTQMVTQVGGQNFGYQFWFCTRLSIVGVNILSYSYTSLSWRLFNTDFDMLSLWYVCKDDSLKNSVRHTLQWYVLLQYGWEDECSEYSSLKTVYRALCIDIVLHYGREDDGWNFPFLKTGQLT